MTIESDSIHMNAKPKRLACCNPRWIALAFANIDEEHPRYTTKAKTKLQKEFRIIPLYPASPRLPLLAPFALSLTHCI